MGERNVIKAALLGAGTVGSGVYALAEMLKDEMFQKTGANLEIKKVLVRNTKKERPVHENAPGAPLLSVFFETFAGLQKGCYVDAYL